MSLVLIVDDEFGLAEMAGELLTMAGHNVATAINGQLALAMLDQMRPDVMLLDVMMPVMSGLELLDAMGKQPALRDIPVVMMSAGGKEWLDESVQARIAGFLQKPFTYDEMMSVLRKPLGQ